MNSSGFRSVVVAIRILGAAAGRAFARRTRPRRAVPALEALETIALMSAGRPRLIAARAIDAWIQHHDTPVAGGQAATLPAATATAADAAPTPQTLPIQTLTLPNTLTNFQDLALSPSLSLFNPALGTLTSVTVTQSATLLSNISSQNLYPLASATITGFLSGSYQINGLSQPIIEPTQTVSSQPMTAGPYGSSDDTVTFPPIELARTTSTTYTDAADLAFYTASTGRTSVTPTMTATGSGFASSSDTISTNTTTMATSTVTVGYTYIPAPVAPQVIACPTVGKIGRIGVHRQKTLLVVPFQGVVNPSRADNPADYTVIARDGRRIPIVSANYNPTTNSVTLRPSIRLNVHHHDTLSMVLPCDNTDHTVVRIRFGSKYSLIGFHDHQGQFVPVRDGHIVRADARRGHA